MDRTRPTKALAICSSLLLGGCFVAYRQKQATPKEEPTLMPSSKSPGSNGMFPSSGRTGSDFILPSSKGLRSGDEVINRNNIDAILNNRKENPAPPAAPPRKTIFPSSKNIDAILRKDDVAPPTGDAPVQILSSQGRKTVLPSSKIGAILTPEDVPKKGEEPESSQTEKPEGGP